MNAFCLDCRSADAGVLDGADDFGTDAELPDFGTVDLGVVDSGPCIPPGSSETCNGLDDDCDGEVDEGFDFQSSPLHCGRCNHVCQAQNADVTCTSGTCTFSRCLDGFADIDRRTEDCEYMCPVFPTRGEVCNGLDDDCDGMIDEVSELAPAPPGICRTTTGTPCAGVQTVCATRGGVTTWYCDYPTTVEFDPSVPNGIVLEEQRCDGQDGDCDGAADDSFATLGQSCDDGRLGACRDVGRRACTPDGTSTRCDLSVLPDPTPMAPFAVELCNGIDDDCDGTTDESGAGDASRVRDDMIRIQRGMLDFWIYTYEASRPAATSGDAGSLTTRACSRGSVRPWASVDFATAQAACMAAGKRLCTNTEWTAACEGMSATTYPYGNTYAGNTCNGANSMSMMSVAATGAFAMCRGAANIYDLSGNLKEWTNDIPDMSTPTIYAIRGGSYESPEFGLTCQSRLSRAASSTILPSLGFRCCSNTAP